MKDKYWKKYTSSSFFYEEVVYARLLHPIHAYTGKAKQAMIKSIGIPIPTRATTAASTTGVRRNTPVKIDPRISQRNNGQFGHNLYLQPNIEYLASCPT